jgi:hypothetical protein
MGTLASRRKLIKQIIFWTIITVGFLALFIPVFTKAQPADVCEVFGNCAGGIERFSQGGTNSFVDLLLSIAYIFVYILGAVAVLFMVIGGYNMVSSNGDPKKYGAGLDTLKYAVLGLIIAIASFAIVTVVGGIFSTIDITSAPN